MLAFGLHRPPTPSEEAIGSAAFVALGAFLLALIWLSAKRGKIIVGRGARRKAILRDRDPRPFWFMVSWFTVFGAIFLVAGLVGLARVLVAR